MRDRLVSFFQRWFDMDQDGDGLPEWSHLGQGAAGSPTLARTTLGAGPDVTTVEAPDLAAYLICEAHLAAHRRAGRPSARPGDPAAPGHAAEPSRADVGCRVRCLPLPRPRQPRSSARRADLPGQGRPAAPRPDSAPRAGSPDPARRRRTEPQAAPRLHGRGHRRGGNRQRIGPRRAFTWCGAAAQPRPAPSGEITYLKFDGLSRVYSVEVRTKPVRP